ncbi:transposase DNA-binding-containing protein [Candidatus Tisiphia endosymbiont of Ditula angustiorana]
MQALSNSYNLGDKWLEREFRHVNFGDQRLIKRLLST